MMLKKKITEMHLRDSSLGLIAVLIVVGAFSACSSSGRSPYKATHGIVTPLPNSKSGLTEVRRIAVMDFAEFRIDSYTSKVTCPLTGFTFTPGGEIVEHAGVTLREVVQLVLADRMFEIIDQEKVDQAISEIAGADGKLDYDTKTATEVGRKTSADLVVLGYLFRYKERVGGKFAVGEPASVAFSISFVDPETGLMAWHARFDKTQKSLFEDLGDFSSFLKGGMVWQSAEEFTQIGVSMIVEKMPFRLAGDQK